MLRDGGRSKLGGIKDAAEWPMVRLRSPQALFKKQTRKGGAPPLDSMG